MLAAKEGGTWREYATREVWEMACSISRGLLALGIDNRELTPDGQEKIAIISPNRPEWIITDLAVQMTGAALTPIYPTISPADLKFVLEEAGVKKLFIADGELQRRFAETLETVTTLEHVFSFEQADVPGIGTY